jgi:hypothetical protein
MARIEQQVGITVVDAGTGARWRNQPAQYRRDPLRVYRKVETVEAVGIGNDRLAGLQFEQLVGVDQNGVGFDIGRGGDGAGDNFALGHQAFHARVDQPLTELIDVENARHQNAERGQVQEQDAVGQRREDEPAEQAAQRFPGRRSLRSGFGGRLGAGRVRLRRRGPIGHMIRFRRHRVLVFAPPDAFRLPVSSPGTGNQRHTASRSCRNCRQRP